MSTKQDVAADPEFMYADLRAMLNAEIRELGQRIAGILAQENVLAAKIAQLRSSPGIGPVSAAMLRAEVPELDRMTRAKSGPDTRTGACALCQRSDATAA